MLISYMAQKLYFKHSIITSGDQDAVESEINTFNCGSSKIVNVTVTPERVGEYTLKDGTKLPIPRFIYHVCIVYTDRRS